MNEERTFHVNSPSDGALPLLPRTRDAPQTAVTVDGAPGCVERGRVDGLQRRGRRAREERVDVVDLLVRLRQGNEVQPSRPRTHQHIVNIERSGVEARATHHGWIQSEKNSR